MLTLHCIHTRTRNTRTSIAHLGERRRALAQADRREALGVHARRLLVDRRELLRGDVLQALHVGDKGAGAVLFFCLLGKAVCVCVVLRRRKKAVQARANRNRSDKARKHLQDLGRLERLLVEQAQPMALRMCVASRAVSGGGAGERRRRKSERGKRSLNSTHLVEEDAVLHGCLFFKQRVLLRVSRTHDQELPPFSRKMNKDARWGQHVCLLLDERPEPRDRKV